ncbi:MAG: Alanyl-tRNA synthetase [Bacteroidota bacterium]
MNSRQIRQSFLDFFASKGHKIVQSAPVVPHGDPTLLFTNAGMNQFKDVFLGTGTRDYTRCADTQKCIRVSGKHNDLEEVGYDTYHHTLFEMLGNWSFGDYYKKEAIAFAWELLTSVWKLPKDRIHATVFRTDDESFELWKEYLPVEQIHRFDEKDNFWEMGETGPCGPCTEIHFDRTPDKSGGPLVNMGVPEVIEVWNLVFIQYNRKPDGSLEELLSKHVDTGMGFERICAVMQHVDSNYDTDVFMPIIKKIEQLSGEQYSTSLDNSVGIAMRVISDHIRTLVFSIADGAMPGNEGRSYVLRRILRRACRYARNLGFTEPILYKLTSIISETMGDIFPEVPLNLEHIKRVIKAEEESFLQTLDRGLDRFEEIEISLKNASETLIQGSDIFLLYDSFGFPADLTELIAKERGLTVDLAGFKELMDQQKERSRNARKQVLQQVEGNITDSKTTFDGWTSLQSQSNIIHFADNHIITETTPFYAEMGGQQSDYGTITIDQEIYSIRNVQKQGNAIIHIADREILAPHKPIATLSVDFNRRWDIQKNHSATHLLHEALRRVLGNHVQQSGSLVSAEYLRFDFSHIQKVSNSEIKEIQALVNDKIRERIEVITRELPIDQARNIPHVKMFFGDKYGDTVRVVTIDEQFSSEFCGGTHVQNSSDIGYFHILNESAIASGIRRIEAITSFGIAQYIADLHHTIETEKHTIDSLHDSLKSLEKELSIVKVQEVSSKLSELIDQAHHIANTSIKLIPVKTDSLSMEELKMLGDNMRSLIGKSGIGVLSSIIDDKINLVCIVTDDLTKEYPAGRIIGDIAKRLGGGGGGKPHMATAGAKDIHKLDEVLDSLEQIIQKS